MKRGTSSLPHFHTCYGTIAQCSRCVQVPTHFPSRTMFSDNHCHGMVRGIYLYTLDLKTSSSSDCGSVRKISPRMLLIARQSRRIVIHETGLPRHLRIRSTMTDLPRVCKFGAFESSHTHIYTHVVSFALVQVYLASVFLLRHVTFLHTIFRDIQYSHGRSFAVRTLKRVPSMQHVFHACSFVVRHICICYTLL